MEVHGQSSRQMISSDHAADQTFRRICMNLNTQLMHTYFVSNNKETLSKQLDHPISLGYHCLRLGRRQRR